MIKTRGAGAERRSRRFAGLDWRGGRATSSS